MPITDAVCSSLLLPLGQAVDPRCEDALHGRRHADLFRGRAQAVRTPGSHESARLDQRLDDLLDEEGIAARALLDELAEAVERRITAEEIGEELLDRLGAERQQRKLLVVGPLHPRGVVLRAEVQEHERPVAGRDLDDDVLDELLARPIEPVKVLEEEDGRLPGAARAGEPPDQVEKLPLPRLGTERRSRPLGIRHAEEIEHEREPLGERLVEQEHPPGDLVARRPAPCLAR